MRFCPKLIPRTFGAIAFTVAVALSAPAGALAASPSRSVEYEVPSLKGNIDLKKVELNGTNKLTAWVRLPAGYDDQPDRRWPVLYLLHGWEDNSGGWLDPKKGDLNAVLPADFPGIVVMPDGGKEWFLNWADDTKNPGHRWGDYLLEEVLPLMESKLRILPGRGNHAIGGLSMGGYGALRATAALPSYFGHALAFSGLVDNQDASFNAMLTTAQLGKAGYGPIWGPMFGPYADATNPVKNARDYRQSRLSVYYGTPSISVLWSLDLRIRAEALLEVGVQLQVGRFLSALKGQGGDVYSQNVPNGSHTWKWWKQQLANAVSRDLFKAPPVSTTADAKYWEYDTMSAHGNAWGLGYKMLAKPTKKMELLRANDQLEGRGVGTVTIAGGAADTDASGNGSNAECTFTVKLPFKKQLPPSC
ncbi:MAG: alpha/beta hydrolase family protein [Solirubrobacteraceae bacterium]|nr:alpha/beta hydrolase family protein [Solirubrobacteraceae bacterium]